MRQLPEICVEVRFRPLKAKKSGVQPGRQWPRLNSAVSRVQELLVGGFVGLVVKLLRVFNGFLNQRLSRFELGEFQRLADRWFRFSEVCDRHLHRYSTVLKELIHRHRTGSRPVRPRREADRLSKCIDAEILLGIAESFADCWNCLTEMTCGSGHRRMGLVAKIRNFLSVGFGPGETSWKLKDVFCEPLWAESGEALRIGGKVIDAVGDVIVFDGRSDILPCSPAGRR